MQRQFSVTYSPSAAIHTQHRLRLLIMESFCRQCLKIIKTTWQKSHRLKYISHDFPLRNCGWIFASGERREDTNNCAIFSTNIDYTKFGLMEWSTSIKHFQNDCMLRIHCERNYYICVRNHYVSDSCEFHAALIRRYTSRSPFTIHILLNSYPHMLPIIMYIFSKWKFLKHYLVQYSLMIQYGSIFSTHQHEHKTSMLDN